MSDLTPAACYKPGDMLCLCSSDSLATEHPGRIWVSPALESIDGKIWLTFMDTMTSYLVGHCVMYLEAIPWDSRKGFTHVLLNEDGDIWHCEHRILAVLSTLLVEA